MVQDRA